MRVQSTLDRGQATGVADGVLRALTHPPRRASEHRLTRCPKDGAKLPAGQRHQLGVVVTVEPIGIPAPTEERTQ